MNSCREPWRTFTLGRLFSVLNFRVQAERQEQPGSENQKHKKAPLVLFIKLLAILPSGSAGKNSKNFWNLEKKGGTTTPPYVVIWSFGQNAF